MRYSKYNSQFFKNNIITESTHQIINSGAKLISSHIYFNHFIFKKRTQIRCATIIILIFSIFYIGGCSRSFLIGGYEHSDMSKSPYKELILEQANVLAASTNPEDWKTAAKYYGSIRMLGEMDECISRYVQKEPELGLYLMDIGKKIHEFYKK